MPIHEASGTKRIRGAWKDLNAKGRGTLAYRKVWRNGSWQWVSGEALPKGDYRAADRHATVYGLVEVGEIVAEFSRRHDTRASMDEFYEVIDAEKPLKAIQAQTRVDGGYTLTSIDGATFDVSSPITRS